MRSSPPRPISGSGSRAGISAIFIENALAGLNLLLFGPSRRKLRREASRAHFSYRGDGPENVLVNFLAEVLSLAYQKEKRVVAARFRPRRRLQAGGATCGLPPAASAPRVDIKSVTYHNLRVLERDGVKSAAVVFDV